MNSRFIIIAILIFIKVIGTASRARAANYLPGYTCDNSMTYKINCPYYQENELSSYFYYNHFYYNQFINQISFNKPIYRCGKTYTNKGTI
ncbi:MAG: hypothetical protein H8E55_57440 [Pelagibacterales bacterium]|nr:hypothetical protein [Pelagibacterales bacterium]